MGGTSRPDLIPAVVPPLPNLGCYLLGGALSFYYMLDSTPLSALGNLMLLADVSYPLAFV